MENKLLEFFVWRTGEYPVDDCPGSGGQGNAWTGTSGSEWLLRECCGDYGVIGVAEVRVLDTSRLVTRRAEITSC